MINFEKDNILDFIDKEIEKNFVPMVLDLQKLVQIKSVEEPPQGDMPFGKGPYQALNMTLEICNKLGFSTTNLDNYVGYAEIGQGDEIIGILTHLDVVPEGEGWQYPPYGGTIINGKMFGRGVSDNKSPAMASIYALNILKNLWEKENIQIEKRIRLIFGTNEETGFQCIKHYLECEKPVDIGFTPDGMFPVIHGEKGILQMTMTYPLKRKVSSKHYPEIDTIDLIHIEGGVATNSVPDRAMAIFEGCKDEIELLSQLLSKDTSEKLNFGIEMLDLLDDEVKQLKVMAIGKAAHASVNHEGINSIAYLIDKFVRVGLENDFFNLYTKIFGLELNGESLCINFSDKYGHLTLNVGCIALQEETIRLSVDIRYPITKTLKEVVDGMTPICQENNVKIIIEMEKAPLYYDPEQPFIQTLLKAYREVTGDLSLPITIGGGTYARAMKNVVAFGATFPNDTPNAHEADEYIVINNLKKQMHIYIRAISGLLDM